jgi:pyruvate dehydrogenase E2 component (dihydrolipoamide acetyltransferase)
VAFEFRLPDIGEGLTEAEIVEWLVEVGQTVEVDQPLVQVETDKAVTDIPSPKGGVLLVQGGPAGSAVKVGEILAVIGQPGEQMAGPTATAPIVGTLQEAEELSTVELERDVGTDRTGEARALPLVRKLARELGVDLDPIRGTGPKGRITREDVEAAAGGAPGRAVAGESDPSEERIRLSRLRRTIAEHMARSWREIPHVTTFGDAEAGQLLAARRALSDRRGKPVPLEALFIAAVVPALQAHPEFNASLDGDELILKRRYDIGIAVDTPDGLIVPVVRDAASADLFVLADEIERLTDAARNRTVTAEELSEATFTITNIGAVGGGHGTPIIPYGTTSILSFGRAREQPVARDGRVEVASVMPVSLSYDHRVIDGALGRRFLSTVIDNLEKTDVGQPGSGPVATVREGSVIHSDHEPT